MISGGGCGLGAGEGDAPGQQHQGPVEVAWSAGPIGQATRVQPSPSPIGEASGGGAVEAVTGAASAAASKANDALQAAKEAAGLGGQQQE